MQVDHERTVTNDLVYNDYFTNNYFIVILL